MDSVVSLKVHELNQNVPYERFVPCPRPRFTELISIPDYRYIAHYAVIEALSQESEHWCNLHGSYRLADGHWEVKLSDVVLLDLEQRLSADDWGVVEQWIR